MATYKTPGVYIKEISIFPPSVAEVETAIPAFIGYTESAVIDGVDYHTETIVKPVKISSLVEYELYFGGAPDPTTIEIELNTDNSVKSTVVNGINLLYDSVRMFYSNGGGDCYIVSVGDHNTSPTTILKDDLLDGLNSVEKVDRPTLLLIPESVHLSLADAGEIHAAMLSQCNKLQDRFAVMDIIDGNLEVAGSTDPVSDFRNNVGMNYLKYGATYYPWLKTTLPFSNNYDAILGGTYTQSGGPIADITALFNSEVLGTIANIDTDIATLAAISEPTIGSVADRTQLITAATDLYNYFLDFYSMSFADTGDNSANDIHTTKYVKTDSNFHKLLTKLYDYNYYSDGDNGGDSPWTDPLFADTFGADFSSFTFVAPTTDVNDIFTATQTAVNAAPYFKAILGKLSSLVSEFDDELDAIRNNRVETLEEVDSVYKGIVDAINSQGVELPPSGAVVGVYASVDRNRGVWKAPANVSIAAVRGPSADVTHEEQENLNIDSTAGKSVNAIRSFTGKGTLIWGARTLAGNDNEWRYVSVRRFFNMVEESVKKSTYWAVFEPNDANTWVKIKGMIENYLTQKWRDGALAGATPEEAFFVKVGLGLTMTAQDILNGIMNVEIGMAAVRPAEFIILKFSHKMQES